MRCKICDKIIAEPECCQNCDRDLTKDIFDDLQEHNVALKVALQGLLDIISEDRLIPESVSYMQRARAVLDN